jgi:hypothetical protein
VEPYSPITKGQRKERLLEGLHAPVLRHIHIRSIDIIFMIYYVFFGKQDEKKKQKLQATHKPPQPNIIIFETSRISISRKGFTFLQIEANNEIIKKKQRFFRFIH